MIYTPLILKAARIAYAAHAGQTDKAGMPYIFHPYHVAQQMRNETEICVALLHDVAEDTQVTLSDLEKEFPADVVAALKLLTRKEDEDYLDYIRKIKTDPIARAVKIADLQHNSDLTRIPQGTLAYEEAENRCKKYAEALEILTGNKKTPDCESNAE